MSAIRTATRRRRGSGADETEALASLDMDRMRMLGVHPMVPFLTRLQIDHERAKTA